MRRNTLNQFLAVMLPLSFLVSSCGSGMEEPFFLDWNFHLGELENAQDPGLDDTDWEKVSIPHDWSILLGPQQGNTAASTGFVPGGIGWYRKHFTLDEDPAGKHVRVEFDGIYNNSTVWINGVELGKRPYGYSSFAYELTPHLKGAGEDNVLAVHVDRTAYADSRWYTGSGIYRDVRLVITDQVHIPQWGVRITTPEIIGEKALVHVECEVNPGERSGESIGVELDIVGPSGMKTASWSDELVLEKGSLVTAEIVLEGPELWSLEDPALYRVEVSLKDGAKLLDRQSATFGIRSIHFDADKGFFLNGKPVKIKGVNMHHDAGCLGSAVPKDVWRMRIARLQSMGCNAIRMAHNPHDPNFMDLCDEMGMLVMAEAFDEWGRAKGKNKEWIGDNAATGAIARSYPSVFGEWAERDLKDLIRRDFNHPSVIMWSMGNEIEWTYPYYPQATTYEEPDATDEYYDNTPSYNGELLRQRLKEFNPGPDSLLIIAKMLRNWILETDTTRYITAGTVQPSVGLASGYHAQLDVSGFNYRAAEYDAAHKAYPETRIIGSENWVSWPEWKAVDERDFVAGIFVWTGYAYLGEAGPWPRKGLNISLFDFAGHLTPRGHMFETLWKEDPKVYMVTTPEEESEFSWSDEEGWTFTQRQMPPNIWQALRKWEWYDVYEHWNFEAGEHIVAQVYTNCEEAELYLNGESLGKKPRAGFEDNVMKWRVPFADGHLEVVGYNQGKEADRYSLHTAGEASSIAISADRESMAANHRDVCLVQVQLQDGKGFPVRHLDEEVRFEIDGPARLLGIDNGSEFNVEGMRKDHVTSYCGRAFLFLQSTGEQGQLSISAHTAGAESETISISIN